MSQRSTYKIENGNGECVKATLTEDHQWVFNVARNFRTRRMDADIYIIYVLSIRGMINSADIHDAKST